MSFEAVTSGDTAHPNATPGTASAEERAFELLYAELQSRSVEIRAAISERDTKRANLVAQQVIRTVAAMDGMIDCSTKPAIAGRIRALHYMALKTLNGDRIHRAFGALNRLPDVFAALEEMMAAIRKVNSNLPAGAPLLLDAISRNPRAWLRPGETVQPTERQSLPTFVAVGPPRTGTTWLHHALVGRVVLPFGIKETNFFTDNYDLGLEWYAAHFRSADRGLQIGELAPTYFDSPPARARMARDLPGCKIICSLRDPVDRMYSNYRILRREAWHSTRNFAETATQHMTWAGPLNLFGMSEYALHVSEWQRLFGKDHVMVALYDDLRADPQKYLDDVCAFIGVPKIVLGRGHDSTKKKNTIELCPIDPELAHYARVLWSRMQRRRLYALMRLFAPFWDYCFGCGDEFEPMARETETFIRNRLRPKIEALEKLIGRDLSAWKTVANHTRPESALARTVQSA